MVDLLDIAPSTSVEVVKIPGLGGDGRLKLHGLSGNAIASIVSRFPDIGLVLAGAGANIGPRLIQQLGVAIGPIIAAGCGHLGDEKAEQTAGNLLVEDQVKLLSAIFRLTFPNGLIPFVQAITALVSGGEGDKPVKVRLRTSPSRSPPSSDTGSRPTMQ